MAEPSKKHAILIHVTKKQLDALLAPHFLHIVVLHLN